MGWNLWARPVRHSGGDTRVRVGVGTRFEYGYPPGERLCPRALQGRADAARRRRADPARAGAGRRVAAHVRGFFPDAEPFAVLTLERAGRMLRVDVFDGLRFAATDVADDIPGLRAVLAAGAEIVRYHPGRRCTVRHGDRSARSASDRSCSPHSSCSGSTATSSVSPSRSRSATRRAPCGSAPCRASPCRSSPRWRPAWARRSRPSRARASGRPGVRSTPRRRTSLSGACPRSVTRWTCRASPPARRAPSTARRTHRSG